MTTIVEELKITKQKMKNFKKKFDKIMWWMGDGRTPKEIKNKIESFDDEWLLKVYKKWMEKDSNTPNTQTQFQLKIMKKEIEKRKLSI